MVTAQDMKNALEWAEYKGVTKGRAEGKAEGEAKGKAEANRKVAELMLEKGIEISVRKGR